MTCLKFVASLRLVMVIILLSGASALGQASFQGLGDLPGGIFKSNAAGISADGKVVVGNSVSTSGGEAFRWTSDGGMVGLGDIPGGLFFASDAWAVSADGSVVVGVVNSALGFEAFRWTSGGGMVGLGNLTGDFFESFSFAVSADGSVVVGRGRSELGAEAFRWTEAGGMIGLGDLPGGSFHSSALATSADGAVVVGVGNNIARSEAFMWTDAGGMVGLGDIVTTFATAISADGTVIVGQAPGPQGWNLGFRWTEVGGLVDLGDLPGGIIRTEPFATSADGNVIVGFSATDVAQEAFVWTSTLGMRSLRDMLTDEFGLDLTGWKLDRATSISADGRTIVGWGTREVGPTHVTEGWIATILPSCGDGIVQAGEDCDDGGESATCDDDCSLALCGDSSTNVTAGEACDTGGETATCDDDCTGVLCGDGNTNEAAGESCDAAGESATCDVDCTPVVCGDGIINVAAGEVCEPFDDSACSGDCLPDCSCPSSCDLVNAPLVDPSGMATNRFLSFRGGNPGRQTIMRVRATSLPSPFNVWNGQTWFVGQPIQICENSNQGLEISPPECGPAPGLSQRWYWVAPLSCSQASAVSMDWTALADRCVGGSNDGRPCTIPADCPAGFCGSDPTVYVYHEGIIASRKAVGMPALAFPAEYVVQEIGSDCDLENVNNYSSPLPFVQPAWSDIVTSIGDCPNGPPNLNVDMVGDVVSILNKFSNNACAPRKVRVDLEPNQVDFKASIVDVLNALSGFSGSNYPFSPTDPNSPCTLSGLQKRG